MLRLLHIQPPPRSYQTQKKVQTEACTFEVLHILLGRRPLTAGCYSLENAAAPFVISQRYNSTAAAASTTAQTARYSDSPS